MRLTGLERFLLQLAEGEQVFDEHAPAVVAAYRRLEGQCLLQGRWDPQQELPRSVTLTALGGLALCRRVAVVRSYGLPAGDGRASPAGDW